MRSWRGVVLTVTGTLLGVLGAAACGGGDGKDDEVVVMPQVANIPAEAWARLASRRVFFGHQSVGFNIMAGVDSVLKEHPEIKLRVVETSDPAQMRAPGIYHARVGQNGAPLSKIAGFEELAGAGVADSGVALLKFCYIDITGDTDPLALFATYQQAMDSLRAAHPGLTILHVTLPLQTDWGEFFHYWRVFRNQLTTHRELNAIRQAYNQRMREVYGGREPLFDVAHWQSVGPDGKVATVRYNGQRVPILSRAWTEDGAHLNAEGSRRIAEALLVTLARM